MLVRASSAQASMRRKNLSSFPNNFWRENIAALSFAETRAVGTQNIRGHLGRPKKMQSAHEKVGEGGANGDGENPGPDHASGDAPFNSIQTFGRPDSHYRAGNNMGCGKRNAPVVGPFDNGSVGALGDAALTRLD